MQDAEMMLMILMSPSTERRVMYPGGGCGTADNKKQQQQQAAAAGASAGAASVGAERWRWRVPARLFVSSSVCFAGEREKRYT